jgi:superfamily I DNA/RNA helicase/mRNA-degrading endonuclease RelE of RelBE toxin-antitoxin system
MQNLFLVSFSPTFYNELLNVPRQIQKSLDQKLKILEKDPISAQQDAKKLHAYKDIYRVRQGDYRIFYRVSGKVVKLLSIRKRDDRTYSLNLSGTDDDLPEVTSADLATPALDLDPAPHPEVEQAQEWAWQTPAPPEAQAPASKQLPALDSETLLLWRIPSELHAIILGARTEDDLLNLEIETRYMERVIDNLFPRSLNEIAAQPDYLLGKVENIERLAEQDLSSFLLLLSPEQQEMVQIDRRGPMLVRGGPGTGKSTLALYRVKFLREAGIERILFTTFTNALTNYSEQLLSHLLNGSPAEQGVTVSTVDRLAYEWYSKQAKRRGTFPTDGQAETLINQAIGEVDLGGTNMFEKKVLQQQIKRLGSQYLLEEFNDLICAWCLTSREEYLAIERRGRQLPLRAAQREAIWRVYERWCELMQEHGLVTNAQVRAAAYQAAKAQSVKPFQALIIDEAQDLTPSAIRFLLALVENYDHIYITADAAQSIYERGFSWKQIDSDLNMSGRRSLMLKRNYRNTQQILEASANILEDFRKDFDYETLYPEAAAFQGEAPNVLLCDSLGDTAQAIYQFFKASAQRYRLPVYSGAVLCANKRIGTTLVDRLNALGCKAEYQASRDLDIRSKAVKVLTMHSAKGLEFPFVAVVGLEDDVMPSRLESYPSEEREAIESSQRRLFFVACTRAMRALQVCGSHSKPSRFLDKLKGQSWRWEQLSN